MLHREDPDGLIVITQPAHAWVAAQLARHWGNDRFGTFAPWEDVCLAAEQHDVGMAGWEAAPTLNPQTGCPHNYIDLPGRAHTEIVSHTSQIVLSQGRYAALLVSLLFTRVWEKYYTGPDSAAYAHEVQSFLARERNFQAATLSALQSDPYYAPYATPEVVVRNQRLVMGWDAISLALCAGLHAEQTIAEVPAAEGETILRLTPVGGNASHVSVEPWPFRQDVVTLAVEGRRLPSAFKTEGEMREALKNAPWVTLEFHLHSA